MTRESQPDGLSQDESVDTAGRMRSSRPAKTGSTANARGQTLQDYVVGISLFVLTVAAVLTGLFGFLGGVSVDGGDDASRSQRISEAVVQNHSTGEQTNELRAARLESTLGRSMTDLRLRWGIENSTAINVSLATLDGDSVVDRGGTKLAAGSVDETDAAATAARIVTLDDGTCDPACRLVVRAW